MAYYDEQKKKLESQYSSDLAKNIQAINQSKDNSINKYNQQFADREKDYFNQQVDADTQSAIAKKNNNELMASTGAYRSGDNITANSRLDSDRAKSIQSILNSQNDYKKFIDNSISDVTRDAQYQIANAQNVHNVQLQKALFDLQAQEQQRQFQAQQNALARSAARSSSSSRSSGYDPASVLVKFREDARTKGPLAASEYYISMFGNDPSMQQVVQEATALRTLYSKGLDATKKLFGGAKNGISKAYQY